MPTSKPAGNPPAALYAVPIHEAIASGDVAKMSAIRTEVFAHLAAVAEMERLLPALDGAIQAKGGPIKTLYGGAIQDAAARGDQAELARMKAEVDYYRRLLG